MAKLIDITDSEQAELALEFAESIHAGFPSPAADHAGERINLAREMTPHPETTFYAHVEGDSMRDAGILDGDIVVVDRSLEPKNGDFIVAQPIRVDKNNEFSVWGVVTYAIHKTRL